MSFTRRHLVTNHFKSHNKKNDKNRYTVINNGEEYIVNEEEHGTGLYYGKLLNGSNVVILVLLIFNISKLIKNDNDVISDKPWLLDKFNSIRFFDDSIGLISVILFSVKFNSLNLILLDKGEISVNFSFSGKK